MKYFIIICEKHERSVGADVIGFSISARYYFCFKRGLLVRRSRHCFSFFIDFVLSMLR